MSDVYWFGLLNSLVEYNFFPGGGTSLYGLYRYVPLHRYVFSRFGINRVSIFAILDINEGYGFCTQVFN